MKKTMITVIMTVLLASGSSYADSGKVTICHTPPGQPNNPQTIIVSEKAVSAHLKHGDYIGACASGCLQDESICDDGNPCTFDECLPNGQCERHQIDCNDGNSCTYDLCDISIGCINPPADGIACDDSSSCTENDICNEGKCAGQQIENCCINNQDCNDNNLCTTDICLDSSCKYQVVDCSVGNKCLAGFCDPTTGSSLFQVGNGMTGVIPPPGGF
jgi:hypothetical protein